MINIELLKKELDKDSVSNVVNKFILSGNPICFKGNIDSITGLKNKLSSYFSLHKKDMEIVGSAKLGISLSAARFGKPYDARSDIDFVVVSSDLFDIAWHELLKLDFQWYKLLQKERVSLTDCYHTIHKGYISPDKLPTNLDFAKKWWKIYMDLSNREEYEYRKIRGRLFKNWWFVEKYYSKQLVDLKKS